jgi:hypothetical protein
MWKCSGCGSSNGHMLSDSIWQCDRCGFLVDIYAWGWKKDTGRIGSVSGLSFFLTVIMLFLFLGWLILTGGQP